MSKFVFVLPDNPADADERTALMTLDEAYQKDPLCVDQVDFLSRLRDRVAKLKAHLSSFGGAQRRMISRSSRSEIDLAYFLMLAHEAALYTVDHQELLTKAFPAKTVRDLLRRELKKNLSQGIPDEVGLDDVEL